LVQRLLLAPIIRSCGDPGKRSTHDTTHVGIRAILPPAVALAARSLHAMLSPAYLISRLCFLGGDLCPDIGKAYVPFHQA
jgi:hypothetical protein